MTFEHWQRSLSDMYWYIMDRLHCVWDTETYDKLTAANQHLEQPSRSIEELRDYAVCALPAPWYPPGLA